MSQDRISILVTGIAAPLAQSIVRAALASERSYRVIAADLGEEDAAIFPQIEYIRTTHIREPQYRANMQRLLVKHGVDLVFLGAEREMLGLLPFYRDIEKETGARFALSGERALRIGMDKLLTSDLLREAGLPYPKTMPLGSSWEDVLAFVGEIGYPCVVKGRRAGEPFIVRNQEDLSYHFRNYEDAVLQEFLGEEDAQEYTVGLFYTPEHGLLDTYCMARLLRYGLTWRGWYEKVPEIEEICKRAVEALKPIGSCNAQLRYHRGVPVIHEFNVRCSSTTVFRALSGWNEIDMAVDYLLLGKKPEAPTIRPGRAVRYFSETWIPNESTG
ncbi:MAG: ATP-grasp domain-containing protein [Anaerolineales bacterium]